MEFKVVVFGSFVVDLMGRTPHLPAPGETVKGESFKIGAGGKGSNQAIAAKRSGSNVVLVTKVGKDEFGNLAKKTLKEEGISENYIHEDLENETGVALIIVDKYTSENEIVVIPGACEHITDQDIEKSSEIIKKCKFLLTQLETNVDAMEKVVKMASEAGAKVILNPAPIQEFPVTILKYVDIITPNEVEASILTGIKITDIESAKKAAVKLNNMGVKEVIITLGSKGCLVKTENIEKYIPCFKVQAIDTTGAGDAFNGGLVTALSEGKNIIDASIFGTAVAALSVTKIGTAISMPHRKEVEKFMEENL